jgi:hypothetical protein
VSIGRRKMIAVAVGAVGAAGIAAGAVAATSGSSDDAGDLAAAINKRAGTSISAADVAGAYQDVLKTHLDQAVAAGKITQAQADEMLQRAKDAPGLPPLGGPGPGGPGRGGPRADILAPVAKALNLTEAQLRTKLEAGSTLAKVAKEQNASREDLIAAISAALTAEGVPAARVADLAAHIADDSHADHDRGRGRGPGGPGGPGWPGRGGPRP